MKKMIFLLIGLGASLTSVNAQQWQISGQVDDEFGPLAGVKITVEPAAATTFTDTNGRYTIAASPDATLIFSFIGMQTQRIAVNGRTTIDVVMQPDAIALDEVVVVGYGVRHKTDHVGATRAVSERAASKSSARFSPQIAGGVHIRGRARPLRHRPQPLPGHPSYDGQDNEEYETFVENKFVSPLKEPLSTFSADVDGASYANMRRYINQGQTPPRDGIRIEELINYFSCHYPPPTGDDPLSITAEAGVCPWNTAHRLVRIGVKAKEIADEQLPASNLVFLIDVSGSMEGPMRLDLVKSSLKLLANNLRAKDRVAIVVYAGNAGEVLPSTPGDARQTICAALDNLSAGGSTAGGAGIKLAYKIARQHFIPQGNNRIILCTDGDFNVGVSSQEGLEKLIEDERKSGVFLTVLGYGMGNYKDRTMQTLAQKGNGNHAYIDNLQEANKALVEEFGSTLYTVAKDVKLQVEFNPAKVQAYRLIGYETRRLNAEDFNDDSKDAGEMGAGHTVTALYEVVPAGVEARYPGYLDDLKYQKNDAPQPVLTSSPDMLTVKIRYKNPDKNVSKKIEQPLADAVSDVPSDDFRFTAAVAMFGHLLRDSAYKGHASCRDVIELAQSGVGSDPSGYRHEFIRLVKIFDRLTKN
ncbi:MAG: von Willebrand factor type A domain-containing protein [Prevotellaceae bacterium]|jgi:Ca-activated chloride channel family protein|nr:von Willebrand factor type A domain-containing protein [Prevotellaceae bacterium]